MAKDDCCSVPVPAPTKDAKPRASRGALAATAASIFAAFLASACCVGPLVFALLGLGGAGLMVKLEPYRPLFIVVTFALLGAGFYLTYRRPRPAPATGGVAGAACACPAPRTNRAGRVMLWVATVVVASLLVFPYLAPALFG
ncbi:MAG: mercury transporter MerT [Myxococcales bacterium]|nr:mercury transporter MerT [Myxococcales bacterium]